MSNIFNKVVPKELIKSVQNVMDKEEVNELKAPTATDREYRARDIRYGEPAKNPENGYTNKDRKNLIKNLRPGFVARNRSTDKVNRWGETGTKAGALTGAALASGATLGAGHPVAAVPAAAGGALVGGNVGGATGLIAAHVSNVTNSVLRKVAKHRTRNAITARQSRERGAAPEPKKVNEVVIGDGQGYKEPEVEPHVDQVDKFKATLKKNGVKFKHVLTRKGHRIEYMDPNKTSKGYVQIEQKGLFGDKARVNHNGHKKTFNYTPHYADHLDKVASEIGVKGVHEEVIDEGKTFRKNDETSWKYKKKRSDRKFSRVVKDNDKDDKEKLEEGRRLRALGSGIARTAVIGGIGAAGIAAGLHNPVGWGPELAGASALAALHAWPESKNSKSKKHAEELVASNNRSRKPKSNDELSASVSKQNGINKADADHYVKRATKLASKAKPKTIKEEDQLDEVSKETLGRYLPKAAKSMSDSGADASEKWKKGDNKGGDTAFNRYIKRKNGIKKAKEHIKEEVEKLDEISKKTLGSYIKKASSNLDKTSYISGGSKSFDSRMKLDRKSEKRLFGIEKAADILVKEEGGAGEIGTDQLVNKYKSVVPGQNGIIKQLKKVMVHEGYVKFDNNTAINIPKSHAKRAVRVYESLKTDEEKIIYESKLIKSVASFQDALNDKNPGV